jgi:hypothetical protein
MVDHGSAFSGSDVMCPLWCAAGAAAVRHGHGSQGAQKGLLRLLSLSFKFNVLLLSDS